MKLARHEAECAARYGTILTTLTEMRAEMQPVIEVYRGSRWAGRTLVAMLKFIALLGTVAGVIYAGFRYMKGGGA